MAQNKKQGAKKKKSPNKQNISVSERQKNIEVLERQQKIEIYKSNLAKLMLSDIKKKPTKTYTKYTKELYRKYIENPSTNEDKIRDMSIFLYRVSTPYRRFVNYLSDIPLFYWNLIPQIDQSSNKAIDSDKILKNYYKALQLLQVMALNTEMRKVLNTVIRDGIFYGFIYKDKDTFFIHKLDPNYCKIAELESGCYNFAFDLSYFAKYPTYLEYVDPYFTTLYNLYQQNTTDNRWQLIDPQRSICIKIDPDNPDENLPLLVGLFEALLDLIDARTLQRNKDEIQNYKLIVQKIPVFDGTKDTDDFALDADTIMRFYNKLAEVVPPAVGVALSPMDIDTVDFKSDDNDNDLLANSMKSVFNDSGISQLLFNTDKTGSVGLDASIKVDVAMVWKIVESIERWIQRYLLYNVSGNTRYFFEILRVDIFNKDKACERELGLANSGVPNKLRLAATNGSNPYETLSSQIFENDILRLHEQWVPLQTSYTQSNKNTESIEPNDSTARNQDANGNKDEV